MVQADNAPKPQPMGIMKYELKLIFFLHAVLTVKSPQKKDERVGHWPRLSHSKLNKSPFRT